MDAEVCVREEYDLEDVEQAVMLAGFEVFSRYNLAGTLVIKDVNDSELDELKDAVSDKAKVTPVPSISDPVETWD